MPQPMQQTAGPFIYPAAAPVLLKPTC